MRIKLNIDIANRRSGEVVLPTDADYGTFKYWADRGDRKQSVVICEYMPEQREQNVEVQSVTIDIKDTKRGRKKGLEVSDGS